MTRRITHKEVEPHVAKIIRVWRSNGLTWATIRHYRQWVRRFYEDCRRRGEVAEGRLTREIVARWAARRARERGTNPVGTRSAANSALWAWSWGRAACGLAVPPWDAPAQPKPTLPPLQDAFMRHRREVRGLADSTARRDLSVIQEFLIFIRSRRQPVVHIRVADVDDFLDKCSSRWALKTLARAAYVLRSFLQFLYSSGKIPHDLATAVASPQVRRGDVPPRALPWADVRRIVRAIDRNTHTGQRDYALLLMMVVYGLGSGEVRGLTLESVDWRRRQVRVVRPKTGREICLPLLPGVAQALTAYLRHGRPHHCTNRALFVQMRAPYGGLSSSSVIRHVLHKHAASAGVSAVFLGSHVLRHSHASRQIDQGASATVLGDILGHRRPESTSVYVRVALRRLRRVSLPVPK